jgi:hypothetical protein
MTTRNLEPRRPSGERYDYVSLCLATDAELEAVMRQGVQPAPARLVGWEFRGWNTPDFTSLLGFRKFKKGFYQEDPVADPQQGVQGYNVKVVQNGLGDDWFDRIEAGQSLKHGWYHCYPVRLTETDCRYPNAVLIDYDCDLNLSVDPTRRLRDYLVQPYADQPDLFLGKAFVALLGPIRLFVSYFVLERYNESTL